MTTWKVSVSKVCVEEEEYSLYAGAMEATAAAWSLEAEMGLLPIEEAIIVVKRHPKTGELLMIKVEAHDG